MIPPTSIDGTDITGATIDGTDVQEITVDGDVVFSGGPAPAPNLMYVADYANDLLRQYDLNNKFDLTGATQTATLSVNNVRDLDFSNAGNDLYVSAYGDDRHEHYSCATPYDISNVTLQDVVAENDAHGISVSPDGIDILLGDGSGNNVSYYQLSSPYDLSTKGSVISSEFIQNVAADCDFLNQGQNASCCDEDLIEFYDLTAPYDFSTRTNRQIFTTKSNSRGAFITDDGTKYFSANYNDNLVREFNLSIPYDISTKGSPVDSLSVPNAIGLHMV